MRLEVQEAKTLVHEMAMPIRWGDMDAMGHVNNTVYFRYFESARIAWLHRVCGAIDASGEGVLIANAFCNFIQQLQYPGDVIIRLYVANPGRSSFDTFLTLERSDTPGVVWANGGATAVWVDFKQQKSRPMPGWFRELLQSAAVVDNSARTIATDST
jgi:acyl-CoA thioester hydrolase